MLLPVWSSSTTFFKLSPWSKIFKRCLVSTTWCSTASAWATPSQPRSSLFSSNACLLIMPLTCPSIQVPSLNPSLLPLCSSPGLQVSPGPHLLLRSKTTMVTTPICLLPTTHQLLAMRLTCTISHLVRALRGRFYYWPHFTAGNTETQRGKAAQGNTATVWTQVCPTTCPSLYHFPLPSFNGDNLHHTA